MSKSGRPCRICGSTDASSLGLCAGCTKGIRRFLLKLVACVGMLSILVLGLEFVLQRSKNNATLPDRQGGEPQKIKQPATRDASAPRQQKELAGISTAPAPKPPRSAPASSRKRSAIPLSLENLKPFREAGDFVTAMAQDRAGSIWFGSEEFGVVRMSGNQITRFTQHHGLGDDNGYAITVDEADNIWVGTLNHGLSMFDGRQWTTYGMLDGLGGLRVYCLALGPDGKTIWCGHENGLASFDGKTWRMIPPTSGLPWREITAICIGKEGSVWIGGALGGIARYDGERWSCFGSEQGLPDERINGMCLSKTGKLWIATCSGAACLDTETNAFEPVQDNLFGVDRYVTCVAEAEDGCVWFGTRRAGLLKYYPFDQAWETFSAENHELPDDFIRAIIQTNDGNLWLSVPGYGVLTSCGLPEALQRVERPPSQAQTAPRNVTLAATHNSERIGKYSKLASNAEGALYIGEDWQTQGDWMSNYGECFYVLAGMGYPGDFTGGAALRSFSYAVHVGNDRRDDHNVAVWVHWGHTDNPKCLQNPNENDRRQADWDDRGEAYPLEHEGPDLYVNLAIKDPGIYRVAFYFINKDAHELQWKGIDGLQGANRNRDYLMEIKNWTPTALDTGPEVWPQYRKQRDWVPSDAEYAAQPTLAQCRVHDFLGGVYKRFLLAGPGRYRVRIQRAYSHNTICSGIFFDRWDAERDVSIKISPPKQTGGTAETAIADTILTYKSLSKSREAIAAAPYLIDDMVNLAMRLEALRPFPENNAGVQAQRLLISLTSEIGLSKDRLELIRDLPSFMTAFADHAEQKQQALDEFHSTAIDIWHLFFRNTGYRPIHHFSGYEVEDRIWQAYAAALARHSPPDAAVPNLLSFAKTYRQSKTAFIAEKAWSALEKQPGFTYNYESQKERAINLVGQRRYAESITAFERAIQMTDDASKKEFWYESIGVIAATQLKDERLALQAAKNIRRLNPESRRAQNVLLELCREAFAKPDKEAAVKLAEEFLSSKPSEEAAREVRSLINSTQAR